MSNPPYIAAIVSDSNAAQQFYQCQNLISAPLKIIPTKSSKCISTARAQIDAGAAVIISIGNLWHQIKSSFPHTTSLIVPITDYDAIKILEKAKEVSDVIGVILFDSYVKIYKKVAPYVGVKLVTYQVLSSGDIEKGCLEMKKRGIKVIIGGDKAVNHAKTMGMQGVIHTYSPDGVLQVLNEAGNMFNAIIRERAKDARLLTMLNAIKDSVICLNEHAEVLEYNLQAEKRFSNGFDVTKSLVSFLEETGISNAVKNQLTWSGESRNFQKKQYICNITPSYSKDGYCGANVIIQDVSHIQSLEHKIRRDLYTKGHVARYSLDDIVGGSSVMRTLIEQARLYAASSSTIFIYGESGTGKEMFAQGIHMASAFAKGPFIGINCTALPESLLESELFGYAEGAFTGARKGGKIGLFEMAHNGTLFLDEIGEIPLSVQAKLLRVLEEKSVRRLGQERYIPINVRIVCATNKDLAELVRSGKFREDLFYRLNVLRISLPPLRKHPDDIEALAYNLIDILHKPDEGRRPNLSHEALATLKGYYFPGNIRELRNIIERLLVVTQGRDITEQDIISILEMNESPMLVSLEKSRKGMGRSSQKTAASTEMSLGGDNLRSRNNHFILQVLAETNGNKLEAARRLGISSTTLWRRLKEIQAQNNK